MLSQADLVSSKLREAWKSYINDKFKGIRIHFVSTFDACSEEGTKFQKRYIHASGIVELLEDIKMFSKNSNLVQQWDKVISSIKSRVEGEQKNCTVSTEGPKDENLFTIGFIGQPNVGKSSLINSIFGKKVVSASRTPGHTKHFQTLHLSTSIRVCDSPGLIFPSIIDKNLQILSGLYNIAQVKDPYGPVLFLSKRINLMKRLKIPPSEDSDQPESVFYICEEYAKKCGFYTSKAGRPDTYRAANFLLRQVIDGKILLYWTPPSFEEEETNDQQSSCSDFDDEDEPERDEHFIEEIGDIRDFENKCSFSIFNDILE